MRISAGIIAAFLFFASSCDSTPGMNCPAGNEQCACNDGMCNAGLTCISGTCFDLGDVGNPATLGSKESAARDPKRNQTARRAGQSSRPDAESSEVGGSRSAGAVADPADAGTDSGGTRGSVDAGAGSSSGGSPSPTVDSGMSEVAGSAAAGCADPGTSCSKMSCCERAACINNTCRVPCQSNTECPTMCCMPFDATRSVCMERTQCEANRGGGGKGGRTGDGGSGGQGGAAADNCSPAGAACGTQGCCDGVSCVNNVCAATCDSEADCASECCLSFFGGTKTCVSRSFCRR